MADDIITQAPPSAGLAPERATDFISAYANNTVFESSAWDLKIIFGQLDQSSGQAVVKQNIAVTIPWAQAKLALYWLRMHVVAEEAQTGAKIPIRKDLLPPEIPAPSPEQQNDPAAKRFYELAKKFREEFIAEL